MRPPAPSSSARSASLGRSTASICQTSSALSIVCNPRRADTRRENLVPSERIPRRHANLAGRCVKRVPQQQDNKLRANWQTASPNRFMIFNNLRKHSLNREERPASRSFEHKPSSNVAAPERALTHDEIEDDLSQRGRAKYLDATTSFSERQREVLGGPRFGHLDSRGLWKLHAREFKRCHSFDQASA